MRLPVRILPLAAGALALLALGCGDPALTGLPGAISHSVLAQGGGDAAARAGLKAFFGLQHTHVAENGDDGQGTLAQAYTYARDRADLDFLGVSSHAHMITDDGYALMRRTAAEYTRPGQFVALLAQEWSSISKGGHVNIFEASERCQVPNGNWSDFYTQWLPAHPEVAWVQFNHPHPGNPLEFGGVAFTALGSERASRVAFDKVAGMALLNGPGHYEGEDMKGAPDDYDRGANGLNFEEEYKEFLNRGWHVGAAGDADNHTPNWGRSSPTRTGVWARSLAKDELIAAFKARRTYATFDHNLQLYYAVNGQPMGSEIKGGASLQVEVTASDPDTVIERLELYGDTDGAGGKPASLVAKVAVGKTSATWSLAVEPGRTEAYYFAKVVYGDREAWAWTSPVWVKP